MVITALILNGILLLFCIIVCIAAIWKHIFDNPDHENFTIFLISLVAGAFLTINIFALW